MEISSREAGDQWAGNMTSWAEEKAIHENIRNVPSNGTEEYQRDANVGSHRRCELCLRPRL
jgi:hypothetical protein